MPWVEGESVCDREGKRVGGCVTARVNELEGGEWEGKRVGVWGVGG